MAWLEDLAKGARITSLGKLAKAAIEHEDWPESESTNYRSVENLLRFVDQKTKKGQVWLDHRPAVKEVLADILGVSPESLDPGSVEPDGPADPRVDLKELRDARPIDLRKEDLFPGIPREVFRPDAWGLSWWLAQAGAGKTVVGRWLEARREATFLRGDRWSEVRGRIPEEGAVYIELSLPDSDEGARFPQGLEGRNICVAAPFLPVPPESVAGMKPRRESFFEVTPPRSTLRFDGLFLPQEAARDETPVEESTPWRRIDGDPKEEWIEDLIRWVGTRMKAGGGFDVEGALEVVRRRFFATSLATPGDYIGVCGVIEKVGVKRLLAGVEIEQLVFAFLESRLERADLAGRHAWTAKALWTLVQGCVEGAVVHSADHGTFPSEAVLKSWLPDDSLPDGDDAGLRRIVDEPGLSLEEIESIRSRAKPSRDGACRELFRLHLLEPCGEGTLALRPSWIVPLARQKVIDRLIAAPGRGLGEVLLRPQVAGLVLPRITASLSALGAPDAKPQAAPAERWEMVRWAIEHLRPEDPASVALLEACFQATGVSLLERTQDAPIDLLRRLWAAQMGVSLHAFSNGPPRPRLLRAEGAGPGWEQAWDIACLAISERLYNSGMTVGPPSVAPWGAEAMPEFADHLVWGLDRVCVLHGNGHDRRLELAPFLTDAWRLAGRLFRSCGRPENRHGADLLFAPFGLFAAMKSGAPPVWSGWLSHEYQLEALAALAKDEDLATEHVLAALWRARPDGSETVLGYDLSQHLSPTWRCRLWGALPPDVLATTLRPWVEQEKRIAWEALLPTHWDTILDIWRDGGVRGRHGLAYIPEHHAQRMLREHLFGDDTDRAPRALWQRFPERCVEASVHELVHAEVWPSPVGNALWRVPPDLVAQVIELAVPHLAQIRSKEVTRHQITVWAHQVCAARGPHWRAAWALLSEIDPPTA